MCPLPLNKWRPERLTDERLMGGVWWWIVGEKAAAAAEEEEMSHTRAREKEKL